VQINIELALIHPLFHNLLIRFISISPKMSRNMDNLDLSNSYDLSITPKDNDSADKHEGNAAGTHARSEVIGSAGTTTAETKGATMEETAHLEEPLMENHPVETAASGLKYNKRCRLALHSLLASLMFLAAMSTVLNLAMCELASVLYGTDGTKAQCPWIVRYGPMPWTKYV
jgi:hypothetical protein